MLEDSILVLIVAVILALVVCVVFNLAQRRGLSQIQKSMSEFGTPNPKIQYDVETMQGGLEQVLDDLKALRATPERLDEYKARLEKTRDDLNILQTNLPHTNEVALIQQNMQRLCTDFDEYKTHIENQIQKFTKSATDDFNAVREQMINDAKTSITKITQEQMFSNTVSRDEFESFKTQIEKSLGSDEVAERMTVLNTIFESTQIKTLNWQCKLITLLRGGLAPDAEQDVIISNGIPHSSLAKFLRKLQENNIIEKKSITAYYMTPDNEWLYSYVENTDWLQRRLESTVKKEKDYQDFVKNNLHHIEDELQLVTTEYELATGRIDIMCTDSHGRSVGVELKYPSASVSDFRQVAGYKNDYIHKTGKTDSRFFIVAPMIPDELRKLAETNGFEWREIAF